MSRTNTIAHENSGTPERRCGLLMSRSLELEIEKRRGELTEAQDQCARHQAHGDQLLPNRGGHFQVISQASSWLDDETICDARDAQTSRQGTVQKRAGTERLGSRAQERHLLQDVERLFRVCGIKEHPAGC